MKKGLLGGIGLAVVIVAGLICIAKCTVSRKCISQLHVCIDG